MNGRIKSYLPARHFGFVTADVDGAEIFFHLNSVVDPDYTPARADRVEFALGRDRMDRPTAKNVRLLSEAPKPAETPGVAPAPADHPRDRD